MRPRRTCGRADRGSAAIEAAIVVPAFALFVGLIIFAGRTAVAHQAVESAAADAARAASITRTTGEATDAAHQAAIGSLTAHELDCASTSVQIDASAFATAIGDPGVVEVSVTCVVNLSDLAVPGVPGTHTVTAVMTSPIDTWRQR
jgi:Flp pilus assembly protein TadG